MIKIGVCACVCACVCARACVHKFKQMYTINHILMKWFYNNNQNNSLNDG